MCRRFLCVCGNSDDATNRVRCASGTFRLSLLASALLSSCQMDRHTRTHNGDDGGDNAEDGECIPCDRWSTTILYASSEVQPIRHWQSPPQQFSQRSLAIGSSCQMAKCVGSMHGRQTTEWVFDVIILGRLDVMSGLLAVGTLLIDSCVSRIGISTYVGGFHTAQDRTGRN